VAAPWTSLSRGNEDDAIMRLVADVVSVMIVDDQLPFRLAARAVLRRTEAFELVGEAADGDEAVVLATQLRPQLILMDINMPTMNGIDATRQIMEQMPDTTVFLCSTYEVADLPPEAATSGYAAYVNKEELGPDLLRRLWDEHRAC
jgi:DNA-binding NarL/FixJ family response regulator